VATKVKQNQSRGALPFITPPEKYDAVNDDFNDWWPATENYLTIISATVQENVQAALLLSLFDNPTLRKLTARALESGNDIHSLSLAEVTSLVKRVLYSPPPIFADRFLTLTLRQSSEDNLDDWAAKVMEQTHKFNFADFTLDDLQTLIYALGLQNDSNRKELFKRMNALNTASPPSKLTFSQAHSFCKTQVSFETACTTINRSVNRTPNTVCKIESDAEITCPSSELTPEETVEVRKVLAANRAQSRKRETLREQPSKPCYFCGNMHFYKDCPHREKTCYRCHKLGHLAVVCKSGYASSIRHPQVNPVHTVPGDSFRSRRLYVQLFLNNISTQLQLDTASDVSIISENTWKAIGCPTLMPTTLSATHAGAGALQFLGESSIDVQVDKQQLSKWTFYISRNSTLNIMGLDLFEKLNFKEKSLSSFCSEKVTKPTCNRIQMIDATKSPEDDKTDLRTGKIPREHWQRKRGANPIFLPTRLTPQAVPSEVAVKQHLHPEGGIIIRPTHQNDQEARHRDLHMERQVNRHHGAQQRQFYVGDPVWTVHRPGMPHEAGVITKRHGHVLYDILTGGDILRRHANQLSHRNIPKVKRTPDMAESSTPNPSRRYPVRRTHSPRRCQ
jgi:hypothetical protein